jgi:hypothetical protein
VAGYFQSLLNRPLTGPHVLRPPRQLFGGRPSQELERDESPDDDGVAADTRRASPGPAARVRSGNGNSPIFLGDPVAQAPPISIVADRSGGVGDAIDRNASATTDFGPLTLRSELADPRPSPVHNGQRRSDLPDHAEPDRGRPLSEAAAATPDGESNRAPARVAASRLSPRRERNDVFQGPADTPDVEGEEPLRRQPSLPNRRGVRQARPSRQESFEEPVSVEIGRVDVIISQPEVRQPGLRPPLHPLSRGLGWAAGPPASLR